MAKEKPIKKRGRGRPPKLNPDGSRVNPPQGKKKHRPAGAGKNGPLKGEGGRPPKLEVDAKLVRQIETMAGLGLTLEQIGLILGISDKTVSNYKLKYPELSSAYQKGRAHGALQATKGLRQAMQAGGREGLTALIFYLKTQCRWKEPTHLEVSGPDGSPIKVNEKVKLSGLTEAAADDLRRNILGIDVRDD